MSEGGRKLRLGAVAAATALWLGAGVCGSMAHAADQSTQPASTVPDNTGHNKRDRGNTLTSFDQGNSEADRTLTQKIRQAVVADDSLSVTAHNVKIITRNGVVTLRGPVKSQAEKQKVAAKATQLAGEGKVHNNLEVAP